MPREASSLINNLTVDSAPRFARKSQILAALREGHATAPALARYLGISRNNASVSLQKMFSRGEVLRGRAVSGERGRPAANWFVAEPRA